MSDYDAAYFEIGIRLHAKLISCDSELLLAFKKQKVPIVKLTGNKKK